MSAGSPPSYWRDDFDEGKYILHSFTPYPGDPRQAYRELLAAALV